MKRVFLCVLTMIIAISLLIVHIVMLRDIPPDRIEIVSNSDIELLEAALENICSTDDSFAALNAWTEKDRVCIETADRFMGQRLEAKLRQSGLAQGSFEVLDYSWASSVLKQSIRIFQIAAAFALTWWLWRFWRCQIKREISDFQAAMHALYVKDYLAGKSIRLLEKSIAFVLSVILCALFLRWIWKMPLTVPWTLLPENSVFDLTHYVHWFNDHKASSYGAWLCKCMLRSYVLAIAESLLVVAFAALLPATKQKERGSKDGKSI